MKHDETTAKQIIGLLDESVAALGVPPWFWDVPVKFC